MSNYSLETLARKINNGSNPFSIMFEKFMKDFESGIGEFNCRVRIRTKEILAARTKKKNDFYYKCDILNAETGEVLKEMEIRTKSQMAVERLTRNFLETLLTCTFSGAYCTPYDTDRLYSLFNIEKVAICDECEMDFCGDIRLLIKHLMETKHKDGIFKKYKYWDPMKGD